MSEVTAAPDVDAHVAGLRRRVEAALAALSYPEEPASLYEPVRYVLASEGKRFRPVLLLLAAEAYGVAAEDAMPAALAVEVFHNFTLVHDDIMDAAPTRRGRPTVHVRWDESTALLAGDLLMGEAYRLLASTPRGDARRLLGAFSRMVARLCEGQALDKAFETRRAVSSAEYLDMIDGKTGALLQCCLELGALLGGADDEAIAALRRAGHHAGQAFQIQDDLLDLVADDDRWGKTLGGDLVVGKKTFLLLSALERASGEEHAWFQRVVDRPGLPPGDVDEARTRMDRLGVLDAARDAVRTCTDEALQALGTLPPGPAARTLGSLVRRMASRGH